MRDLEKKNYMDFSFVWLFSKYVKSPVFGCKLLGTVSVNIKKT